MRVAIISDVHANLEALQAMPYDSGELWVLGDLVNYGPNPNEVEISGLGDMAHRICGQFSGQPSDSIRNAPAISVIETRNPPRRT
jgi:hypothetical protein